MKISKITITMFGNKQTMYRVCNLYGDVLQVFTSREDAQAWIKYWCAVSNNRLKN